MSIISFSNIIWVVVAFKLPTQDNIWLRNGDLSIYNLNACVYRSFSSPTYLRARHCSQQLYISWLWFFALHTHTHSYIYTSIHYTGGGIQYRRKTTTFITRGKSVRHDWLAVRIVHMSPVVVLMSYIIRVPVFIWKGVACLLAVWRHSW